MLTNIVRTQSIRSVLPFAWNEEDCHEFPLSVAVAHTYTHNKHTTLASAGFSLYLFSFYKKYSQKTNNHSLSIFTVPF